MKKKKKSKIAHKKQFSSEARAKIARMFKVLWGEMSEIFA